MVVARPIGRRRHSGEIIPLNWSGIPLGFPWWKFCKWLGWGVSGPPWGHDLQGLNKGLERQRWRCMCLFPFLSFLLLSCIPFNPHMGLVFVIAILYLVIAAGQPTRPLQATTRTLLSVRLMRERENNFNYWLLVPLPHISYNFFSSCVTNAFLTRPNMPTGLGQRHRAKSFHLTDRPPAAQHHPWKTTCVWYQWHSHAVWPLTWNMLPWSLLSLRAAFEERISHWTASGLEPMFYITMCMCT